MLIRRLGRTAPVQAALLGTLVFALVWANVLLALPWRRVPPIWLPNSVWVAALLLAPKRARWALLAAGVAGNFAADLATGLTVGKGAAFSLADGLEVFLCGLGVERLLGGRIRFDSPKDIAVFGAISAIAAAVGAGAGSCWISLVHSAPLTTNWVLWALGDALGLMLFTPMLVGIVRRGWRAHLTREVLRRAGLVLGVTAASAAASAAIPQHPLFLLASPIVLFATLQLELAGAAMAAVLVAAASIAFVGVGWVPASIASRSMVFQLLALQAFLLVTTVSSFPVAAVLKRRRDLEAELIRSRDAMVEANRLANLAQRLAGIGYWRIEPQSGEFAWSDEMYRIYGRDPALGSPSLEESEALVHPDDRETVRRHREIFGNGEAPELAVRIVRPDGEVRHVIARSLIERDDRGEIVARFGTCTDVTEVKRAEEAARQSEDRYRFLAENAPDMITRAALDGEIAYISPGSVRVFGYTPEEMVRQNAQDMVHPDDFDAVMQGIFSLINERRRRLPEPLRYRARHKDGSWIWIETNPTLIFDEAGEPVEFIDVVRNITQSKVFEAELEEARRRAEAAAAAKSAFLANMSHELRTPLTSIIGFSRLMGERGDLAPEARHYARRISDASEALLSIINDVLDFSKLEAGQVELEIQPLSVARLIEETTGIVAIQAAAKGLDLRADLDARLPQMIGGDVARLRQVLLNFLSNAVKFTERGSVTVKAGWRGGKRRGRLRISVSDTGAGIAPENVGRLFERFSQAEVSINRTHGGTGLGLAISKGIIELMGGQIGVETRVGKGSSFWLEVPAEAAAAPALANEGEMEIDCPPLRILMVDDTAVNRELVRLMLAPLGFEIEEAGGGAEGVKAAMSEPFDLILMDVRMPGVDGLEATRVIRATSAANCRTPILALTADVQPENAAACRAAGMDDILPKPIVPQQLLSKIVQWGVEAAAAADPEAIAEPVAV